MSADISPVNPLEDKFLFKITIYNKLVRDASKLVSNSQGLFVWETHKGLFVRVSGSQFC